MALKPLHDLIAAHVLAASRLHGDDTTVPVLAKGKTDTARAWVYVRDDAPFAGPDPPAALFRYARDRSGDHPVEHLRTFTGILQADAYAGYPLPPVHDHALMATLLERTCQVRNRVRQSRTLGSAGGGAR